MRSRSRFGLAARLLGGLGLLVPLVAHAGDPPTTLLSDETVAVVRVDLARFDASALARLVPRPVGPPPFDPAVVLATAARLVDGLRATGATDAFLLLSVADLPGPPLLAVAAPGADAPRVRDGALASVRSTGLAPPDAVTARLIRGWAVVGPAAAVDRLDATPPGPRPDLLGGLEGSKELIVRAVVAPGPTLRRALAEALPELPPSLGSEPTHPLTDGLEWAAFGLTAGAEPRLVVGLQARDAPATEALGALLGRVQAAGVQTLRADPTTRDAAPILASLKPDVVPASRRITVEADARAIAPLALAPFRLSQEAQQEQMALHHFKQIGLAVQNFYAAHNTFPPAYRADATGKPLLSWRVLILPYLDEQALFQEFHLDEPWDSPHNQALIPRMPPIYAAVGSVAEGRTTTLAPRGPDTMLRDGQGLRVDQITDGTATTLMVIQVAAQDAVPWTKPDDYRADILPNLGGRSPLALTGDGGAHRLRVDIKPEVFRALRTVAGGEVVGMGSFQDWGARPH